MHILIHTESIWKRLWYWLNTENVNSDLKHQIRLAALINISSNPWSFLNLSLTLIPWTLHSSIKIYASCPTVHHYCTSSMPIYEWILLNRGTVWVCNMFDIFKVGNWKLWEPKKKEHDKLLAQQQRVEDKARRLNSKVIRKNVCYAGWHCPGGHISRCLLPATHREIRDGIEVRAQHFSVLEELVSKGVKPVQRDEQVGGCHPFLEKEKKGREEERINRVRCML